MAGRSHWTLLGVLVWSPSWVTAGTLAHNVGNLRCRSLASATVVRLEQKHHQHRNSLAYERFELRASAVLQEIFLSPEFGIIRNWRNELAELDYPDLCTAIYDSYLLNN